MKILNWLKRCEAGKSATPRVDEMRELGNVLESYLDRLEAVVDKIEKANIPMTDDEIARSVSRGVQDGIVIGESR